MARGDILLVTLPESDKREEKGTRSAIAVQAEALVPKKMIDQISCLKCLKTKGLSSHPSLTVQCPSG